MTTIQLFLRNLSIAAAGTVLSTSVALAAGANASNDDAQARYRQDMAVCNSGQSNQDLATCRLEARNALAEAKRGGLNDAPGQYQQNTLQRCNAFKGDDRSDCEARMQGNVEGSVGSGGVLREGVTIVPAK
jgi:phosphatidylserine/phosphatidylglycerophosphate/cardiolipin synthase-like enzyme